MKVSYLKKVGPRRAALLSKLGVETISDLLWHLPRDYQQYVRRLAQASEGDQVLLHGTIVSCTVPFKPPYKAVLLTDEGEVDLTWFSGARTYIQATFAPGESLTIEGQLRFFRQRPGITHPKVATATADSDIMPLYPLTENLSQKMLQDIFTENRAAILDATEEVLPPELVQRYHLPGLRESLAALHYPSSQELAALKTGLSRYHKRLIFEEIFLHELGRALVSYAQRQRFGIAIDISVDTMADELTRRLGFTLTEGQQAVVQEIQQDLAASQPMNRLLQGDVGSGKTAVALYAMVGVTTKGYQALLLAPTEVLAQQHYTLFARILDGLCQVELLCGSLSKKQKDQRRAAIHEGAADIIIGTHALLQEGISFHRLGLSVIDEQHRFGVEQRAVFARNNPGVNQLYMSATPIPRTLALTMYADMALSSLKTLPVGRQPVQTLFLGSARQKQLHQEIEQVLQQGLQVYIVAPLIEESEKVDLENASRIYEQYRVQLAPYGVDLLHGRMGAEAKQQVMERFGRGETQVLVSTTVIEVGVDYPRASLMVIYHPERFGLSQLHQLRGRVGRGSHPGRCIFFAPGQIGRESRERLQVLVDSTDGFYIAQKDLEIRGPGQLFGMRQWGVPSFLVADPIRDVKAWEFARDEVRAILARDPALNAREHARLREYYIQRNVLNIIH